MRPHLDYGMLDCSSTLVADINRLLRIQRLDIRLVSGIYHLSYEERLQRLVLHSPQRRRLRADLITTFKMFMGFLDVDPRFFSPSHSRRR